MNVTLFVVEPLPNVSVVKARRIFVPGSGVSAAVQLVVPVAGVHAPPFNWNETLATCPLSVTVPVALKTELLTYWPGLGKVMARFGGTGSVKFATNVRLDCITKVSVGELVVRLPVQLIKVQFCEAAAVIEKVFPISS